MPPRTAAPFLLGALLLSACADENTSAPESAPPLSAAVRRGEKLVRIGITNPRTTTYSMGVGASKAMSATMYYHLGGTLNAKPYATWLSVNPCVASVSNVLATRGLTKGVKAGTTLIIVTAFGKADTVKVTVTGAGNTDPTCEARLWAVNWLDVSFTATPAPRYPYPAWPKAGAKISKLVTFGWTDSLSVGQRRDVRGELWYTDGAKLNAESYGARYLSTNGAVATVNSTTGLVVAVSKGRTTIIQKLGSSLADTIPVIVR